MHVPEIWQHPDWKERPANELDWSAWVCVCVLRGACGSQPENWTARTSGYPRGLWGLTPALLPHFRGMRCPEHGPSMCVSKQDTAAACECVYVCVCETVHSFKMRCCPHLRDQTPVCLYRVSTRVSVYVGNEIHNGCGHSTLALLHLCYYNAITFTLQYPYSTLHSTFCS